jgi:transcriptional regulator with XRE-family HTH domain
MVKSLADADLDPVVVALGQRLLKARLQHGARLDPPRSVSQMEAGRMLGVTGVTVGAWEAGRNDPGVSMLYRLADLYGVRRVWLLTGIGAMYGDEEGDLFTEIKSPNDLRRALGEPEIKQPTKKKRGNGPR